MHSTSEVASQKYRLHGRVDIEAQGNLLLTSATGPFNKELLDALVVVAFTTYPTMAARGPWAQFVVFHESAMASMEVLDALVKGLQDLKVAGLAPAATAYCLPPSVEGARLMAPLFVRCFAAVDLPFAVFEQPEPARQWIDTWLNPHCGARAGEA